MTGTRTSRERRELAVFSVMKRIQHALDCIRDNCTVDCGRCKGKPFRVDIRAFCIEGEQVFFERQKIEGVKVLPTVPGQIYSRHGVSEFQISGMCEHHYDEFFKDPEEEPADDYDRD